MLYLCRFKPLRHYLRGFLIAAWAGDKIAEFSFPEISFHFPLRPWFFFVSPAYAGKSKVPDDCKADDEGSPPRMRGKVLNVINGVRAKRITPAYAGKSVRPRLLQMPTWDHPRVCGEKALASGTTTIWWGSPPRMRGKVSDGEIAKGKVRITPAYAGKRPAASAPVSGQRDHPRVCGEKCRLFAVAACPAGSPPRMRGKDLLIEHCLFTEGITPAYAGKRLKRSRSTVPPVAIVPLFPSVCNKTVVSDGSPAGRDAPLFLPAENAVPASPAYNLRSL